MNDAAPSKAVLVTGATGGVGLACALGLAAHGWHVFAGTTGTPGIQQRVGRGRITPLPLDVTVDDEIVRAVETIRELLPQPGLQGLVNCAGIGSAGPLEYVPRALMARTFDVNVTGALAVIQAFLPMLRKSTGRIVNIGSTSGKIPSALNGAYCASKFALEALTQVLRAELSSSGVTVVAIDPGVVATPFWTKLAAAEELILRQMCDQGDQTYARALARRQDLFARLRDAGSSPDRVGDAVVRALSASRPRRRYIVGWDARLKVAIWSALPEAVRDRVIRRGMRG